MEKQLVVISRHWNEPFIRIDVTEIGIGITMTLDDFVAALEIESGQTLGESAKRILAKMKAETVKVM